MNESEFDVQQVVIKQINNHEVKLLWDLDWKKISAGFNAESLRTIVTRINEVGNRIAAVRACLSHYRYYLVDKDYNYYTEHWDRDCAFKTLCEMIIWDLEDSQCFTVKGSNMELQANDHDALAAVFGSEKAKKLLARLSPEFCRNGRWGRDISKTFISQVAHVLSGLLEIPDNKKWVYFERLWNVAGLSKAFYGRMGKPLDDKVKMLYPEYSAY